MSSARDVLRGSGPEARRRSFVLGVALWSSACGLIAGLEDKSLRSSSASAGQSGRAAAEAGAETGGAPAGGGGNEAGAGMGGAPTGSGGSEAFAGTTGAAASGGAGASGGIAGSGGTVPSSGTAGSGGAAGNATALRAPSCKAGPPGAAFDCGASGSEDCCESHLVEGGVFDRYGEGGFGTIGAAARTVRSSTTRPRGCSRSAVASSLR
jgi:hypothetical protein